MTTPFKDIDEFLAKASDTLPKDQYREVWHDLRTMNLGAEIILGGFHCDEAIIVKIGLDGEPKWIDQIAVIGTGSAEALAFFAQNSYDETEIQSQDCLMRVFEALTFVSKANKTVSRVSRFEVKVLGQKSADITDEFFALMKKKVRLRNPVTLGDVGEFLKYEEDEEEVASDEREPTESKDDPEEKVDEK